MESREQYPVTRRYLAPPTKQIFGERLPYRIVDTVSSYVEKTRKKSSKINETFRDTVPQGRPEVVTHGNEASVRWTLDRRTTFANYCLTVVVTERDIFFRLGKDSREEVF